MTRKPDGWVHKDWRAGIEQVGFVELVAEHEKAPVGTPVCLVPPALLDEIESFLTAVDARFFREDWIEERAKILLNKLGEVRGEPLS